MFINSRDGLVTNTKADCNLTLRRKDRRIERRVQGSCLITGPVYTYHKPEMARTMAPDVPLKSNYTSGPVYTYHKPEPTRPLEETKKSGFLSKIGAFIGAVAASINEMQETELTPNIHMDESDFLVMQSMEESAVEYGSEEEAKAALKAGRKPYQSKSSIRHARKLAEKRAADTQEAIKVMSALDLKYKAEAEARRYNDERKELFARFDSFADSMPKTGAYRYVSREYLNELKNEEISKLLDEIQEALLRENVNLRIYDSKKWNELEEYMLFAKEVNVKRFIQLLNTNGPIVLNHAEIAGLVDWAADDAAKKADFRYGGDITRNWCITNLKNAFYEAYSYACEDGGKLDHDPVLSFPNGAKTRLSRFIGDTRFNQIAEKGAHGKDITELQTEEVADVATKDAKAGNTKGKKRKAA